MSSVLYWSGNVNVLPRLLMMLQYKQFLNQVMEIIQIKYQLIS